MTTARGIAKASNMPTDASARMRTTTITGRCRWRRTRTRCTTMRRARVAAGSLTALALIGCAMLGTAGAYAYRSYTQFRSRRSRRRSSPLTIRRRPRSSPPRAGDPQSNKFIQDRLATAAREQIVSKQEEPVALKELGTQAAPRVVLRRPVAPVSGAELAAVASRHRRAAPAAVERPERVRTVTIRPDGTDVSGRPVGALPHADLAISLRAPMRAHDHAARSRAAAPRPQRQRTGFSSNRKRRRAIRMRHRPRTLTHRGRAATADPGGARARALGRLSSVQVSSQKTEADAQASFRSLQAKFPNELGGPAADHSPRRSRQPRASYYRAMVGPFGIGPGGEQFCASYKPPAANASCQGMSSER